MEYELCAKDYGGRILIFKWISYLSVELVNKEKLLISPVPSCQRPIEESIQFQNISEYIKAQLE